MYKVTDINYNSIIAMGKYSRVYEIGKTVTAEKDSLGLMVFQKVGEAINFGEVHLDILSFRLLEVEPIGRQFIPTIVCVSGLEHVIDGFYKDMVLSYKPPYGTICVPALKVIRELDITKFL